ncbi:ABC transporter substrate-binding protein [Paenibacillus thalictri]|uniref:Sugar ABC transporter substrate-binding protein n=1 Tax=Paenibacillus thalictri TaxID=2527873 RepID=A0A4Q9DIV8_9BACL|nr:sugar ABC transporter substrate-binding protein [Paenibacillus thalictri]TBL73332.1 sugar ABC transporter substrate-binding protein [Paenibacillus thalictri]
MKKSADGRRRWALPLMLAAVIGLSACTGTVNRSDHAGDGVAQAEKVTLTFWSYPKWLGIAGTEPNGTLGDWEADAAKRFMDKHRNVKIETEFLNPKAGPEKVAIAIQTNSMPDVLGDSDIRLFEYAQKGLIVPIGDYLDKEYTDDYYENVWAQTELRDGKHYYLPWSISPQWLMVNRTLFEKAGAAGLLPVNEDRSWTTDEYVAAIRKVSASLSGVYGVGLFGDTTSGDAFLLNWIWGFGARTFSADYSRITLNNHQGIAGMKFLQTMVDEKLANPGAAGIKQADALVLFNQQKVATIQGATIQYARMKSEMARGDVEKFDIYVTAPPHAPGERATSYMTTYGYGVFKSEDPVKQKWAIEFAKFLGSKENAEAVKASESLSTRKSFADMYKNSTDENVKFAGRLTDLAVDGGLAAPGFNKQRAIFAKKLQSAFTKVLTPEQALQQFEDEANEVVKQELMALEKRG